jgi:magnesium-transporting ATPase (P-type)
LNRRAHLPTSAPSTRDRLEMLRLSDAGWSIPKIARHLQRHEQTVRHWIKVFLLEGFDALVDPPRPGKPSAITQEILAAVRTWIETGDRIWSASQVAEQEAIPALEAANVFFYLPAYSPELSEIEPIWNAIKHHEIPVRSHAQVKDLKCAVDGALTAKAEALLAAQQQTTKELRAAA